MTNPEIKVKRRGRTKKDSTQIQMMVESNTNDIYEIFDKSVIIKSLVKGCDINEVEALKIADNVEKTLIKSELTTISSSYIRQLINEILRSMNYEKWLKYNSLSIAVEDIRQLIEEQNKENSNTSFGAESINLTVAGQILKQYAFRECIDPKVTEAHLHGDIYVHDADFFALRPYCSGNSIEYIKKYGLRLPNMIHSNPAQHALVLVNHFQCFASYLQGLFAGAIGADAVNVFFAPFLEGMEYKEIKQVAQHLIFSFAQLAANRGAQVVFSDFNLFFHVPKHYENTPAIGLGGKYTGKNYKEYEKEARLFLKAIFEVAMEGDANGANFPFPKLDVHVDDRCFNADDGLVDLMCELNSKRGSAYVIYDRGDEVKISECCRMQSSLTDEQVREASLHPEEMRFSAWANCSIILPRIAYKYKKMDDIYKEIDRLMDLAMVAHKNKYDQICKLMALGENGPMGFLAKGMDGKPYLKIEDAKFLIGMIGLNEMVQCLCQEQLHESESALILGLNIMAYLYQSMERHANKYNLKCAIEQTPGESLAMRSALADVKHFPEAIQYVKGDIKSGDIYYTNSVHLPYDAKVDILTRIVKQSKFDPLIKAGSITHIWHSDIEPDPQSLKTLYKYTLEKTNTVQTADSPEFTICPDCHKATRGLFDKCPSCGSTAAYGIGRITGYYSPIRSWSKGKSAELKDRTRVNFDMPVYNSKSDNIEKILFFSTPNCSKCDDLKHILAEKQIQLEVIDTQTSEGLALGCYYDVVELPCLAKVKGDKVISKISGKGSYLKWLKENK